MTEIHTNAYGSRRGSRAGELARAAEEAAYSNADTEQDTQLPWEEHKVVSVPTKKGESVEKAVKEVGE